MALTARLGWIGQRYGININWYTIRYIIYTTFTVWFFPSTNEYITSIILPPPKDYLRTCKKRFVKYLRTGSS